MAVVEYGFFFCPLCLFHGVFCILIHVSFELSYQKLLQCVLREREK